MSQLDTIPFTVTPELRTVLDELADTSGRSALIEEICRKNPRVKRVAEKMGVVFVDRPGIGQGRKKK